MNNYIPTKLVQSNAKQSWINQNVKKIRRRKQRLYNKARSTNLMSDWKNYKEAKKQMQKVTRQAFNKYMYRLIHNSYVNGKRKRFYKHIKSLRSDHCGIPSLQKDDYIYTEGYAKANLLNDYFCSVFSQDGENPTPTLNYEPFSSIPPIELNISGICKILKDLDPSKAPGPDHIPIKFLKLFASELSPSLLLVYKASLEQGVVPSAWKKALITPVFKKGVRTDPANYRPISLTSIPCKVLEHIIYSHVMSHLEHHNILTNIQFGFRQRRSADLQLLLTVHDLALGLNKGSQTDAILLDFSKAFDKVSHRLLLLKLQHHGIRGQLLNWITSFLQDRTQQVVCDGCISEPAKVMSGVPQGSVLGPLLFLIFINDLPLDVNSTCRLFADDCLLYRQIDSVSDANILQQDLNSLEVRGKTWLMQFNPTKCVVLTVTNKLSPITSQYKLYNHLLAHVSEAKYLGLTLDKHLNFNKHIDVTCKKANASLAFIRRNTYFCNRNVKIDAYKTYVLPIMEYAAFVWSPHTSQNINKLETIQRRAARFVMSNYDRHSSVSEMLHVLQWSRLQERRNVQSLLIFYKILNGLVDVSLPDGVTPGRTLNRGHSRKFTHILPRINAYKFSFFPRVLPLWNSLPSTVVHAQTYNEFQELLSNSQVTDFNL